MLLQASFIMAIICSDITFLFHVSLPHLCYRHDCIRQRLLPDVSLVFHDMEMGLSVILLLPLLQTSVLQRLYYSPERG